MDLKKHKYYFRIAQTGLLIMELFTCRESRFVAVLRYSTLFRFEVKIHTQSGPCRVLNKVTFLHMRLSTLQDSRVLNKA